MRKFALLFCYSLALNLYSQDYIKVCQTLNQPLRLSLIAYGNKLNQSMRIYQDYKTLIGLNDSSYRLLIRIASKPISIQPEGPYPTQGSGLGTHLYFDGEARLVKTRYENTEEEYTYDQNGRLSRISTGYVESNLKSEKVVKQYTYDDQGIPVVIASHREKSKSMVSKRDIWMGKYNDLGQLIEEISFSAGKPDWKTTYLWEEDRVSSSEEINVENKKNHYIRSVYLYENDLLIGIDRYNKSGYLKGKSSRYEWTPIPK